jgi:hypothetical protein
MPRNIIGGVIPEARNIIANTGFALIIRGSGAIRNRVQGNFIGTGPGGTFAQGNAFEIRIPDGASGNLVGALEKGSGNLVSGNATYEIREASDRTFPSDFPRMLEGPR